MMDAMAMPKSCFSTSNSPLLIQSMATQKPILPASIANGTKKKVQKVRNSRAVKLLTRVEQLRLLTKAEKAGVLSAAERLGLSLSTIERLGLLSKAEELGVLSAATDPGTPSGLFSLSIGLIVLGPVCVYFVPEDYPWQIGFQVLVAFISLVGGSAAFGASNLVSNLQKSSN
ncbi:unnamed protein product [Cuscuta europaea]|uniref:Uncharacterized protein n=1 Tax=Cuscuta europaea TaxID=41803 RepID=A0A9P0Z7U0_CUSEU|nr:unnamed protein product [Cuscuta europaea]